MTPPPPCFTDEAVCLGFLFSYHLYKGSSLSHRSINTVPKLFWLTFFANSNLAFLYLVLVRGLHLAVYICNSESKSPEDSRSSEYHPSFLEVVSDFTDTSFRVHFHSFYGLSVINYCCFHSRSGSCWLLVSLVVSKLLISPCPLFFAIALIDLLFSFSIQIASFSLKVSSLGFILVCVCHHQMQDSECRSNGYNW